MKSKFNMTNLKKHEEKLLDLLEHDPEELKIKYNWKLKQLKKQKKELKALLKEKTNISEASQKDIEYDIIEIKEMIDSCSPIKNLFIFPKMYYYLMPNKLLKSDSYSEYFKIPMEIQKIMLGASEVISGKEEEELLPVPSLTKTDEEIVQLSQDFYHWLPKIEYTEKFMEYLNSEKNVLRISRMISGNAIGNIYTTYYPSYQPYFSVSRVGTIEDMVTLNHEIAHGILREKENLNSYTNSHYFLSELEGSYFDSLSIKYLKEKEIVDDKTIAILENNRFMEQYQSLLDFTLMHEAIQSYNQNGKMIYESMQENIDKRNLPIAVNDFTVTNAIEQNPQDLTRRIFSYLISLDLEKMDVSNALNTLENIRFNKTDDVLGNLQGNGITFSQDGYQNFQEKVKTYTKVKEDHII